MYFGVLCLTVVPLPPSTNPYAVQLNNSNNDKADAHIVTTILQRINLVCPLSTTTNWNSKGGSWNESPAEQGFIS
jgi:hypothetical protein